MIFVTEDFPRAEETNALCTTFSCCKDVARDAGAIRKRHETGFTEHFLNWKSGLLRGQTRLKTVAILKKIKAKP